MFTPQITDNKAARDMIVNDFNQCCLSFVFPYLYKLIIVCPLSVYNIYLQPVI